MYIRCVDCQSSTWIENLDAGSTEQSVTCESCGRGYGLTVPDELGATQREQYKNALEFAEDSEIDLPSAYSVLLGIMSLDQARGLKAKGTSLAAKAATARIEAAEKPRSADARKKIPRRAPGAARPGPDDLPYDRGFRRAVNDGCLTARQAMERGNRKLMATRLARAHHLPIRLAYDVADNRISLPAALQTRGRLKRKTDAPRRAAITPKQQTLIAVAASGVLLIVLLNGIHLWESFAEESREVQTRNDASSRRAGLPVEAPAPPPPHGQPPPVPPASMVRKDDGGRVLEVRGPNPRAVLTQFCESSSGTNRFQPVELTSTVPPVSGSRLGLFRDFDDLESLYAIRIRKDPRSRRWVAGDGRGPVRVTPAPDLPADAQRTPVEVP